MKKGIVIALMVVFSVFAVGVAFAAINADGTMTINKDAKVFPAKKLNADGTKKKNPVTFNHKKHGADRLRRSATTRSRTLKAGATAAKSCFECHGPEAKDKQLDTLRDDPRQDRQVPRVPQGHEGEGRGLQGPDGVQGRATAARE